MGDETKNGLMMVMIGTFLTLGSTAVRASGFPEPCMGAIGGLLILLGILFLFLGRREISDAHAHNVMIALVLMIIAVIMAVFGVGMLIFSLILGNTASATGWFYVLMAGGMVGAIAYYFLLVELENDLGRKVLIAAVIVTIVAQIIVMAVAAQGLSEIVDTVEEAKEEDWTDDELNDAVDEFQEELAAASAATLLGQALILFAVYIPYDRIMKGELRPRDIVHRFERPYGYDRPRPPHPEYPCSRCGHPLVWVEKYREWFCERCDRYD